MTLKRTKRIARKTKESFLKSWYELRSLKVEKNSFLVYCIFLLSVLDALFTLAWIKTGLAVEANPILIIFLDMGDSVFLSVKILLTLFGCIILHMHRKSRLGSLMIASMTIAYTGLAIYHFLGAWGSLHPESLPLFVEKLLIFLS